MRVNIKPLSVNETWQGKRFKTKKYKEYEKELLYSLPRFLMPPPPYEIELIFGFSNIQSDIDNPVKPLIDILQKKYDFNDKEIMELHIQKRLVSKGNEYIDIEIYYCEKYD